MSTIFSGLPSQRARALNLPLFLERRLGHVFLAQKLRIGRRDLHRQIVHQLLEILGAGHEIGFAVHFDQHAQLRAGMDVAPMTPCLVVRAAFFAADAMPRLRKITSASDEIALGFDQRALALHHPRSGAFPELLYHLCGDIPIIPL